MSRVLPVGFRQSVRAQQAGEAYVILLEITSDKLDEPFRMNNTGGVFTSNGVDWPFVPFAIVLPDDQDSSPKASLTIENVSREIGRAIEQIGGPAGGIFTLVRSDDPDVIVAQWDDFMLNDFVETRGTVSATLSVEDFSGEPWPAGRFTPEDFPDLF